jgi:NADH-quinone oxidoreductase subunit N
MTSLIILFVTAIIVLFVGLMQRKQWLIPISCFGIAAAIAVIALKMSGLYTESWTIGYASMMHFDHFADSFSLTAMLATLLIFGLAGYGFRQLEDTLGDHLALLLFSLCGALCLFSFKNIVVLFIGIEILSIPLYVLAGSRRRDPVSNEAALKYYLMGAFTTGIFLFGAALLYGATGSFDTLVIVQKLTGGSLPGALLKVGIALLSGAFLFKIAAAPFHFWAPDVYEGSPNVVTTYMATVVKTAAIAAFFRFFFLALQPVEDIWATPLAVVCALTMTLGNVTAIFQDGFKRMLAYSGIAHAGYLLVSVLALDVPGSSGALLYYVISYAIANVCAFGIFMLVSKQVNDRTFSAYNGLGKTYPLLAAVMAISMLSMAGIPPTAGFFGKYFLFAAAFQKYPLLVLIAVVNSAISIYYYFKVLIAMYFRTEKPHETAIEIPTAHQWVLWAGLILMIGLVLFPGVITFWAEF